VRRDGGERERGGRVKSLVVQLSLQGTTYHITLLREIGRERRGRENGVPNSILSSMITAKEQ
jgi:hypothetical protein